MPTRCARPVRKRQARAPTSSSSRSSSSPAIPPRTWCASRRSPPPPVRSWKRWPPRPVTVDPGPSSAPFAGGRQSSTTPSRCWTRAASRACGIKRELPNDDVFYEKRYFDAGPLPEPITIKGVRIGVPICEDIWHPEVCARLGRRARSCCSAQRLALRRNKQRPAQELCRRARGGDDVPLLYLNQVGGQDELVFDGASFALEPRRLAVQGTRWESELIVSDWARRRTAGAACRGADAPLLEQPSERLARLRARPARLRRQERLPARGAGALRRHRQRGVRGHGRRCARGRRTSTA